MDSDPQTKLTFLSRVPSLTLADPLAEILGVLKPGGVFRYTYEDAVKLCGHSCPTVARAYLMTCLALQALYGGETPIRGDLDVTLGGARDDGSTGPMAQVVSLLTGAAPESGFGGLMGRWRRKDLLRFDSALKGRMVFRRRDTGKAVEVSCELGTLPASPELPELMTAALTGEASMEERSRFGDLWQSRVEDLLTGDPSRYVRVRTCA